MGKSDELVGELMTVISKDRKLLNGFKNVAVKNQNWELASLLREIETDKFPQAHSGSKVYKESQIVSKAMELCDLGCTVRTGFVIKKVASTINKVGDKFDLKMAAKITAEANKIFGLD